MASEPVVIPEKIYFKIGEVCDLLGVQAHVLRYWETEFSMLSPQKNKSGQRSYRRKDVEIALRIKQLLYQEMFTIAGARKKLQSEARDVSRPKSPTVNVEGWKSAGNEAVAPSLFDMTEPEMSFEDRPNGEAVLIDRNTGEAIKTIANHLLELREMLRSGTAS